MTTFYGRTCVRAVASVLATLVDSLTTSPVSDILRASRDSDTMGTSADEELNDEKTKRGLYTIIQVT